MIQSAIISIKSEIVEKIYYYFLIFIISKSTAIVVDINKDNERKEYVPRYSNGTCSQKTELRNALNPNIPKVLQPSLSF